MADRLIDNPNWQSFASSLETDRGLPTGMLRAIALNETAGGAPKFINATSTAKAQGMFQFVPGTATQYNVNVKDPADSTRGAADYLSDLMKMFKDPHLAAAAYNWGQGNLNQAIEKAKQRNIPVDAHSLADNGLLPNETAKYIRSLPTSFGQTEQAAPKAYSPELVQQTRAQVFEMSKQGLEPRTIVDTLARSPVGQMISDLRASGVSNADIVSQIGGADLAKYNDVQARNPVSRGLKGAGIVIEELARGGKQLLNIGDQEKLRQEQIAAEKDVERQAILDSTAGKVGYVGAQVAPLAVADILAPEIGAPMTAARLASTVGRGAAVGGAQGALTPTTQDGQRTDNVLQGALLGGALGGGANLAGNALGVAGNKLASVGNTEAKQAALAKAINERIGQDASVVNSEVSAAAHADIGDLFTKAAKGENVTIPAGFGSDVTKMTAVLDTTPKAVSKLTALADGSTVAAQDLLNARSTIVSKMRSPSIDGADKQVLSEVIEHIDTTLNNALPQAKQEMLAQARDQYRHLMAVDNMIAKTNDSGVLTPSAFNSAIKQGSNKRAFVQGKAPFQNLQELANGLKEAPSPLGKFSDSLGTMLAVHHPVVSIAKNALEAFGGNVTNGLGKVMQAAGGASDPAYATALGNVLRSRANELDTRPAANLSNAIVGNTPERAAAQVQAQNSVVQQRVLSDALAAKAAQSAQAAGLTASVQGAQQMTPAMQQALLAALAQRTK